MIISAVETSSYTEIYENLRQSIEQIVLDNSTTFQEIDGQLKDRDRERRMIRTHGVNYRERRGVQSKSNKWGGGGIKVLYLDKVR